MPGTEQGPQSAAAVADMSEAEVRAQRLAALKSASVNEATREVLIEQREEILKRAREKLKRFGVTVASEDQFGTV